MIDTLAAALSLASGFILMGYKGQALNVIATSIAINLVLAPLTAVIARRRGHSTAVWYVIGLALGAWALASALLLGQAHPQPRRSS